MKKLLTIIVLGLLWSGNAYAEKKYSKGDILFKNDDRIHIVYGGLKSIDVIAIAREHCGKDKNTYLIGEGVYIGKGPLLKMYKKKGFKFTAWDPAIYEFICSKKVYSSNPPNSTFRPGKKLGNKWSPISLPSTRNVQVRNNSNSTKTSQTRSAGISFTIKDKKEQCAAIGFKPATDKFADCVLRLVELDLKKQISNPTIVTKNPGNQAIVNELKRSNNMKQSQFLMNLSNQLLNPSSPASSTSSSSCTVRGGTIKRVNCW